MNTIFSMDFQLRAVYCHHFYFQYIPVSNRLPYGNITIMLSLKYYIASLSGTKVYIEVLYFVHCGCPC